MAVAFSGGCDSTALLHAIAQLPQGHEFARVRAIHINHHLQPAAAGFARHCRAICRTWGVKFSAVNAPVSVAAGQSMEEAARQMRYAALSQALEVDELLLLAQHADDQLETVLLALQRGAGVAGLAGMPAVAPLGRGWMLRPWLALSREQVLSYANSQQLQWVDDPSNADLRFERNFLRSEIVPRLRARWPAIAATVSRSARHCATAAATLAATDQGGLDAASDGPDLDLTVLRRWPSAQRMAVIRLWLRQNKVRAPDERRMHELLRMLEARTDAQPWMALGEIVLRREADRLLLTRAGIVWPLSPAATWRWQVASLHIAGLGELGIAADRFGDLDMAGLPRRLQVISGQDAVAHGGRRLRKLMQELGVPVWRRCQLPCLMGPLPGAAQPVLLAIGDLWLTETLQADEKSRRRGRIVWRELR
jgi:tRNA(Ile)-lysidine synthase